MNQPPINWPEVRRLIDEHPLAWVVSRGAGDFGASLLPMLAESDDQGRVVSLLGHFGLSNVQLASLKVDPRAAILFLGPHAYISPEYVSQPRWGPTWNYASVAFDTELEFLPEFNREAVTRLVTHVEHERRDPWTVDRMGDRFDQLIVHIIAFRAHVKHCKPRFKLAQDESAKTLGDLLGQVPDAALVSWMQRHNPGR